MAGSSSSTRMRGLTWFGIVLFLFVFMIESRLKLSGSFRSSPSPLEEESEDDTDQTLVADAIRGDNAVEDLIVGDETMIANRVIADEKVAEGVNVSKKAKEAVDDKIMSDFANKVVDGENAAEAVRDKVTDNVAGDKVNAADKVKDDVNGGKEVADNAVAQDIVSSDKVSKDVGTVSDDTKAVNITAHEVVDVANDVKQPRGPLRPWHRASANRTIKRAIVHWATTKYVDETFAVAYSARTIGEWDEDVILITDDNAMPESKRKALACLDIDIIFYDPTEVKKQMPSVGKDAFYYKLLTFLLPQLREYDVIYYMDLDMVILGPLRKVDPERDFEKDVILVMDDNFGNMSIVQREGLQRIATPEFYVRFPGANETLNGPNKSPSGCAGLYWMFPKRLPSIEQTLTKINAVLKDYDTRLRATDQAAVMLIFWGQWRMVYHNSQWGVNTHWGKIQPYTYKPLNHTITKEPLVLIHTGRGKVQIIGARLYYGVITMMTVCRCVSLSKPTTEVM